jgi:hypothetical protein
LKDIPEWNMEKVSHEIQAIQQRSGCDFLDDLLTAIFIAHTKVLTSIRINSEVKNIEITVPKVEHFLFKLLCESSKLLWGNTYLFSDTVGGIEKQKNYRQIEELLRESVKQTVRSMVPVKSLLKDIISKDKGDAEDKDREEEEDKPEEKPQDTPASTSETSPSAPSEVSASAPSEVSASAPSETSPSVPLDSTSASSSAPLDSSSASPPLALPPLEAPLDTPAPAPLAPSVNLDKKQVGFTDYDTVFDLRDSNIIYEPKDRHLTDNYTPDEYDEEDDEINKMIESSEALSMDDNDAEDLLNQNNTSELTTGDFEEL